MSSKVLWTPKLFRARQTLVREAISLLPRWTLSAVTVVALEAGRCKMPLALVAHKTTTSRDCNCWWQRSNRISIHQAAFVHTHTHTHTHTCAHTHTHACTHRHTHTHTHIHTHTHTHTHLYTCTCPSHNCNDSESYALAQALCWNCTTEQIASLIELTTTIEEPGITPHGSQWLVLASDYSFFFFFLFFHTHTHIHTHTHTHTHTCAHTHTHTHTHTHRHVHALPS